MSEEEQLEVMRYWVSEASKARRNIAFIRGFEEIRRRYVESVSPTEEPKDPAYNAVARVSIAVLNVVLDALISFSFKAFDQASQASLTRLKNALLRNAANDDCHDTVNEAFKQFQRNEKVVLEELTRLRNKLIAHIDYDFVLDPKQESLKIKEVLLATDMIIGLVDVLAAQFEKIGTVESSNVSGNSLVITPTKFAETDAEEFWRVTFCNWAK
ncbi:hypothetical protein FTO60_12875 [Octadecabacter sp. SW4]|uniref:AbiU2 domain-containing protein n=1 Tax=Octadecabacter sp. SW4 TaxID=2602067 RepID=UPI0011C1EB12|nr:hypothetical protein [Octadecabacter sp. SW4]QEE36528.1 hypothetical protein FTO60_12875 [Octadecabacter sp. SW4]